jgi:dolichol-phosphate mannosyltransferase
MDRLREIAVLDSDVQILSLSARFGHQMSLLAGIDAASDATVIVMMDSDLQHPPSLIPELIRQYQLGNDIVYTVRKDTTDASFLRKQVGNLFYGILGALSQTKINANASDFRLISQRVARLLRIEIRERNLFLRGVFSWLGFNQTKVEYIAGRREAGSSKYSLSRMINLAVAGILSFSTKPLQLSIFAGVWLAGLSFLIGLYTILEYFRQDSIPSGWTTIVTLLVFFNGVQLVFTGILGVYIGGIFEEVKGRPHYIVEEAINIDYEKS